MPNFTFTKDNVEIFVVDTADSNKSYKIDTNEISFGQTFQEKSFEVKTIQSQGSFEGSVINKANPVEFSLNTPLLKEATNKILFDKLVSAESFDLYISSQYDVWKLEKCVIQDGQFEINKSRPLRLAISGEASKLSTYTPNASANVALNAVAGKRVYIHETRDTNWVAIGAPSNTQGIIFTATGNGSGNGQARLAIPGTLQNTGITTTTYIMPVLSTLTLGTTDVSSSVQGVSVELQNGIEWNNYNTVHGALTATNAATSQYPQNFRISKRVLGGSIRRYLTDTSTTVNTWNSNTNIRLVAGNGTQGLDFNISNTSFTNRMAGGGDVFMEEYNWRMTQNPTTLSSVITYTTI